MKTLLLTLSIILPITLLYPQNYKNSRTYFENSDKKLNEVYGELLNVNRSDTIFVKDLKVSQRAWLRFRDAQLTLIYPDHASVEKMNSLSDSELVYLAYLTDNRTRVLAELLNPSTAIVSGSSFSKVNKDGGGCNDWKLIYYNSDDGETIEGNPDDLINAVESGKQIRVVVDQGSVTFAAEAQYLWVFHNIVYAQNNGQVSVGQFGNELKFLEDSYYWMFLVNSNGERDMIRWSVGEHKMAGRNKERVSVKWFVKN